MKRCACACEQGLKRVRATKHSALPVEFVDAETRIRGFIEGVDVGYSDPSGYISMERVQLKIPESLGVGEAVSRWRLIPFYVMRGTIFLLFHIVANAGWTEETKTEV